MMVCNTKLFLLQRRQLGLALPTVMALFMISSVMLLADWRNITLAHGWSRYQAERWQLKQAALNGLTTAAQAVTDSNARLSGFADNATLAFPSDETQWLSLQTQLPINGCRQGICRPLLNMGNRRSDWFERTSQAQSAVTESGQRLFYWVEVLPARQTNDSAANTFVYRLTAISQLDQRGSQAGWQAVWQPATLPQAGQSVRLADMQRVLELLP
jgi:hypothetical protein